MISRADCVGGQVAIGLGRLGGLGRAGWGGAIGRGERAGASGRGERAGAIGRGRAGWGGRAGRLTVDPADDHELSEGEHHEREGRAVPVHDL